MGDAAVPQEDEQAKVKDEMREVKLTTAAIEKLRFPESCSRIVRWDRTATVVDPAEYGKSEPVQPSCD